MCRWEGGEIPKGGRAGRARSLGIWPEGVKSLGIWPQGGEITGGGGGRAKSLGHRHIATKKFCYFPGMIGMARSLILLVKKNTVVPNTGRLVLKKNCFCVGEYAEYGFDQQRLIWYVFRLWDMVFS